MKTIQNLKLQKKFKKVMKVEIGVRIDDENDSKLEVTKKE